MKPSCNQIKLASTNAFPKLLLDYLQKEESLKKFYNAYPDIAGFEKIIKERKFSKENRAVLCQELEKQYEGYTSKPEISKLNNENTFTVTTGHQLNIFTGPLYIIYKIVTIINLAKELKKAYPTYDFVPVYWMATEDHDLEEIQSVKVFDQKYKWDTNQKGAVGRMKTDGLAEIASKLGAKADLFQKAYKNAPNLGSAVRQYMHELFGAYGLITIDADTRAFKSLFSSVIKDDLVNHNAYVKAEANTQAIAQMGYKTTIQAREINFFYLEEGLRERIEKDEEGYKIVDTNKRFSKEELLKLADAEPEKFSPNVVLRPLYEEVILPNLAYIGGPSEVPYWLQLKGVFDHYKVDFPALIPRNFALVLNKRSQELQEKLGFSDENLFMTGHEQQQLWVRNNSQKPIILNEQKEKIATIFEDLKSLSSSIDQTLNSTSEAFETKTLKLIDSLEKKILRAEKRNHSDKMGQIRTLKANLFPGGGLQERKDNIISFLSDNPNFIADMIERFDPLSYEFNILRD